MSSSDSGEDLIGRLAAMTTSSTTLSRMILRIMRTSNYNVTFDHDALEMLQDETRNYLRDTIMNSAMIMRSHMRVTLLPTDLHEAVAYQNAFRHTRGTASPQTRGAAPPQPPAALSGDPEMEWAAGVAEAEPPE